MALKLILMRSITNCGRFKLCSYSIKLQKLSMSTTLKVSSVISSAAYLYHTHSSQSVIPKVEKKTPEKSVIEKSIIVENNAEYTLMSLKYSLICLGISVLGIGSYLIVKYGQPPMDEQKNQIRDEYSNLPIWQQYLYRSLKELEKFTLFIQQPSRDKLLPDPVKFPYHQPPYTLILELTDILVHPDWTYNTGWRFKKRPGLDYFLESLAGMYEMVIFTAEQGLTVFPLVDALDTKNLISYKLVRDATHFVDGHHVKNLDKLNRDLSKVVVIDWNPESVKFHQENLLNIGKWNGNDNDTTLIDLASFLVTVAQNEVDDVREVLSYYKTFENPLATFRQKQKEIFEDKPENFLKKQEKPRKNYFY